MIETPVKPNRPAMIDTTRKISAHFRIVIARSRSVAASLASNSGFEFAVSTSGDATGSTQKGRQLLAAPSASAYLPTLPGKPGWAGSSPGRPLGDAPVPIV